MSSMVLALGVVASALLALAPQSASALGFGGGGCGCAPPPPPCIPVPCFQPVPIQIPSLCLPQIQLPQPCGCCGKRKKREASIPVSGSQMANVSQETSMCNSPHIRRIILKNLHDDPTQSKIAIHSELKAKLGGEYVVICAQGMFSFVADSDKYCIDGSKHQTCSAFKTSE